ncbi:unnamed protein product [Calypogeia fissa]
MADSVQLTRQEKLRSLFPTPAKLFKASFVGPGCVNRCSDESCNCYEMYELVEEQSLEPVLAEIEASWASLETDLKNATTKTIEEHTSASRNEKIDFLRKNWEELERKVSSQNSFLNFDKLQTDRSYVSVFSLRDGESSLRFLLGNLQSKAEELWLGHYRQQDPVPVLEALFGVINKMFTVGSKLGNTREWMSEKLNFLVKRLKSKGIVEKYLQSALHPSL